MAAKRVEGQRRNAPPGGTIDGLVAARKTGHTVAYGGGTTACMGAGRSICGPLRHGMCVSLPLQLLAELSLQSPKPQRSRDWVRAHRTRLEREPHPFRACSRTGAGRERLPFGVSNVLTIPRGRAAVCLCRPRSDPSAVWTARCVGAVQVPSGRHSDGTDTPRESGGSGRATGHPVARPQPPLQRPVWTAGRRWLRVRGGGGGTAAASARPAADTATADAGTRGAQRPGARADGAVCQRAAGGHPPPPCLWSPPARRRCAAGRRRVLSAAAGGPTAAARGAVCAAAGRRGGACAACTTGTCVVPSGMGGGDVARTAFGERRHLVGCETDALTLRAGGGVF